MTEQNYSSRYLEALTNDPLNTETRFDFAKALLAEGDLEGTKKQLHVILTISPMQDEAKMLLERLNCANSEELLPKVQLTAVSQTMPATAQVFEMPVKRRFPLFSDIGGMEALKKAVRMRIVEPFLNPGLFQKFSKKAGGGILLYGPPGCGKTMLAKAIANECGASFVNVEISQVLGKWVGESEFNLAQKFEEARSKRPSVLFIDELDALAISRAKSHSDYSRTLVNELLNQLDGMAGSNDEVLVLGATNMPWDVDPAVKRPGRFSKMFFVPPPDVAARAAILELNLKGVPLSNDINILKMASQLKGFSGADLCAVIEAAKEIVLDSIMDTGRDRDLNSVDLSMAIKQTSSTTSEWMQIAHNLVYFGDVKGSYEDLKEYIHSKKD